MPKPSPIIFLIENQQTLLEAYRQSESKPKKTWESLQKTLPDLAQSMSFSTFMRYLSVLAALSSELERIKNENVNLKRQLQAATKRLDRVRRSRDRGSQKLDKQPKRIAGWNVQKAKDGYYRCYRKIGNKVHCIYIGKTLNIKKARSRIGEKQKALGL